MEKLEIHSHLKIFREINSLVISLVKPLLSRHFGQKSVRGNFRNFHTELFYAQVISQLFVYKLFVYFLGTNSNFWSSYHET